MRNFKSLFITLLIGSSSILFAQNAEDAMRYSQTTFNGDARFMAMGGAMGALGANISCVNYNPAGLGLYRTKSEWTMSPGLRFANVKANHYGQSNTDYKGQLNFSQLGIVGVFDIKITDPNDKKHKQEYKKGAIAFTLNKTASFAYNTTIDARVFNTSINFDFVKESNGKQWQELNEYYEYIAWSTYLTNNIDSTHYWPMVDPNSTIRQTRTLTQTGSVHELSVAYGYNMNNKLYLGGSVNVPRAKYNLEMQHHEEDDSNTVLWFKSLNYSEYLNITGLGVNLKLGAIYRVNEYLRFGAYLHTPTVMKFQDVYESRINASYDVFNDPNYGPILSGQTLRDSSRVGTYNYKITTPMRAGFSVAFMPNEYFAFDVDAEYVTYNKARLGVVNSPDKSVFINVNNDISNNYKGALNLRVGGEFNIQPVIFRAGYAMYGSSAGKMFSGDGVKNSFCFGLGTRKNSYFYDFSYVLTKFSGVYQMYDKSLVEATKLKSTTNYILFTIGKKI